MYSFRDPGRLAPVTRAPGRSLREGQRSTFVERDDVSLPRACRSQCRLHHVLADSSSRLTSRIAPGTPDPPRDRRSEPQRCCGRRNLRPQRRPLLGAAGRIRELTMALLDSYFDASGSGTDKPEAGFVTVGGYVGDEPAWRRFERRWADYLKSVGITTPFRMSAFITGSGDFAEWANRPVEQMQVLCELASIINRSARVSIATTVKLEGWAKANEQYRLDDCHVKPYAWQHMPRCPRRFGGLVDPRKGIGTTDSSTNRATTARATLNG